MFHEDEWGPLIFADPERVQTALRVWKRIRKAGDAVHPYAAARDPRWGEWMSPQQRHQLLALSTFDQLAFLIVVEAETLLIEALVEISAEPDMRAALEQHRPQRGEP